jgi:hypothetical protein
MKVILNINSYKVWNEPSDSFSIYFDWNNLKNQNIKNKKKSTSYWCWHHKSYRNWNQIKQRVNKNNIYILLRRVDYRFFRIFCLLNRIIFRKIFLILSLLLLILLKFIVKDILVLIFFINFLIILIKLVTALFFYL